MDKETIKQQMLKRSNAELIKIIDVDYKDYQKLAVDIAIEVLHNRNLSSEEIEKAKQEILDIRSNVRDKANEPLESWQKIMFLLFCWGVIPWIMAGTFKNDGYDKKYKDAWKFMKIGLSIIFGIVILSIVVDLLN